MKTLKEMHDATLLELNVAWASGELACTFRVGGEENIIARATGLVSLKCPRQFPWGRSVSVNEMRAEAANGRTRFTIEMQSGDLIEADVDHLRLEVIP